MAVQLAPDRGEYAVADQSEAHGVVVRRERRASPPGGRGAAAPRRWRAGARGPRAPPTYGSEARTPAPPAPAGCAAPARIAAVPVRRRALPRPPAGRGGP